MAIENQIEELQAMMKKAKDRRHFERYQAVYLFLDGYKMKEIAKIIGRQPVTVSTYISHYKKSGIEGLALKHSPGKPPKLPKDQKAILLETVATKVPADVGFTARYNWTLALVVEFVKNKWDIAYSLKGMSLVLHSLGLSYTRPTYTLEKADPEKQKEFTGNNLSRTKKSF
jgi:putative transposase